MSSQTTRRGDNRDAGAPASSATPRRYRGDSYRRQRGRHDDGDGRAHSSGDDGGGSDNSTSKQRRGVQRRSRVSRGVSSTQRLLSFSGVLPPWGFSLLSRIGRPGSTWSTSGLRRARGWRARVQFSAGWATTATSVRMWAAPVSDVDYQQRGSPFIGMCVTELK